MEDDKRRFGLLLNFLKRNEQFKNYWEHMADNIGKEISFGKFRENPFFYENMIYHWLWFGGEPFNIDLDEAYERLKRQTGAASKFCLSDKIDDIRRFIDGISHQTKDNSLQNIDQFVKTLKSNICRRDDFYIKIDLTNDYSMKEITHKIQDIIKKEKEERYYHLLSITKGNAIRKARRVGLDELERYLLVYDTREVIVRGKKNTWRNVYEIINQKMDYTEEKRQRLLRDYSKAKEIIRKSIDCQDIRYFP